MQILIIKYTQMAEQLRDLKTDTALCAAKVYENVITDLQNLKD